MVRRPVLLLVAVLLFLGCSGTTRAFSPEVAAGVAAAKAAPELLKAAKGLAAVPAAVGQTLLLPLGLVETALCPLPVFTLQSGLRNVACGLKGPFKLVGTCLKLPLSLAGAAAKAVNVVP